VLWGSKFGGPETATARELNRLQSRASWYSSFCHW